MLYVAITLLILVENKKKKLPNFLKEVLLALNEKFVIFEIVTGIYQQNVIINKI